MAEFKTRIRGKRDTSANWTAADPVLLDGEEIIVDTEGGDVRKKIGDGVRRYTQLPFSDEKLRTLIDGKVAVSQGKGNAGKVLGVKADGNVGLVDPVAAGRAQTWGDLAGQN